MGFVNTKIALKNAPVYSFNSLYGIPQVYLCTDRKGGQTFNSLYGIHFIKQNWWLVLIIVFQFPLWDSNTSKRYTRFY